MHRTSAFVLRVASALALITLAACSERASPEPSAASAAASATAEPGAAVSTAPSATAPEADRSPIRTTEKKDRLALHATAFDKEAMIDESRLMWMLEDRALALHPLRGGMMVSYAGYVMRLADHQLTMGASIFPQEAYTFTSVSGTFPDLVVAQVEFDSWASPGYQRQAPIKETQHYRMAQGKDDWSYLLGSPGKKVVSWKNGSLLALQSHGLNVAIGDEKAPKQAPPKDGSACRDVSVEIEAVDIDALPSGEAFVLGRRCGTGPFALERWAAAGGESVIEALPDAPAEAKRGFVTAGSPNRAYAVLSTGERVYAARWDGAAFRKIELSVEGEVRTAFAAADGTLFLLVQQKKSASPKAALTELVRVTDAGEVSRSAAFAPSPGSKIWAADANTAYVASYGSMLSTKPGLVFVPPKKKEKEEETKKPPPPPKASLPPWTEACTTPFVFLYDVSDKAPPGYTFPTTRKALASFAGVDEISLVELEHGGVRRLGVKVPGADAGKALVEHVVANMPDEKPSLVCLSPAEGARVIPIR